MKLAGFVLTGGRSTRMGRDKATLPVGGQTLCEHIGDVLTSVAGKVFLVGHPERYAHLKYECRADLHPDLGPLSGLETALEMNAAEFNAVASCDTFHLKAEWLAALLKEAQRGRNCVVAKDAAGNIQPLFGIYRNDCRAVVAKAILERRLRMMDLLQELNASIVKVDGLILNLNTLEEYNEIANAGRRI